MKSYNPKMNVENSPLHRNLLPFFPVQNLHGNTANGLFHEKTTSIHAGHLRQWSTGTKYCSLDHQGGCAQIWSRLEFGATLLFVLAKLGPHAGIELAVDGGLFVFVPFG